MDEAILIEIAQRFRQLEDLAATVDKHAAKLQEYSVGAFEVQRDRDAVIAALEACREDMVAMQESSPRQAVIVTVIWPASAKRKPARFVGLSKAGRGILIGILEGRKAMGGGRQMGRAGVSHGYNGRPRIRQGVLHAPEAQERPQGRGTVR